MTQQARRRVAASMAAITLGWAATPALAQEAAAAPAADDSGEIIVTATKTATVASKTPIALSVFSGDQLTKAGANSVADLRNLAPSVEIGSASQGAAIAIRGIGSTDPSSKGSQGVVFNLDGIPFGRPQVMGLAFFDLERVEVLRGPQGTLYGRSATGGVINLITAKPKHELQASAAVELGNFATRRADAMVNVPLGDMFAVRAAVNYNKRDGYLYPVLVNKTLTPNVLPNQRNQSDEDNWSARLSGLAELGENGSLVVTGTFGHIGGTGDVSSGALYNRVTTQGGAAARQVYYNPYAGVLDDDYTIINGELNYNLGPVRFTYDGGHLNFRANDNKFASTNDPAANGNAFTFSRYLARITVDSHEVRFSNADAGALTWVVGGNIWKEKIDEKDGNWKVDLGASCPVGTVASACIEPNPHIVGPTSHKSQGLFGQATYEVLDGLKLTGGLRYTWDDMARNATLAVGATANNFLNAAGTTCDVNSFCIGSPNVGASKTSKLTWRAGVDYQITPSQLVYASVATGYKAGGFNDIDPTTTSKSTAPYAPEQLIAYEVGFKGRIAAGLRFNTSAYYYDYSKYQLTGATFLTPSITGGPPAVLIYTVSSPAKAYGWENELNWEPTSNDTLQLTATLEGGEYGKGTRVGFIYTNRVDFSGKRLDRLPTFTASLSYEHRFQLAHGGYISAGINEKYNSGYFVTDFAGTGNPFAGVYSVSPAQYKQTAFTRTDLTLGYTSESGKLTIGAFVRNLENDLQLMGPPTTIAASSVAGVGDLTTDATTVRISAPRTFGVRLGVKY
jgi:iron complex outermembrane receptor protein